jgi:glycosyltransferase involved in cell wall biosynthesis
MRYFELQRLAGRSDFGPARPKVSLVIPTLNEALGLAHVLPRVPREVDEIVVVDGHSRDRTIETVYRVCPSALIVFQAGRGKGNALKEGIRASTGDIIITMDGDGSMDPDDIPEFVARLRGGYDFVKGSRELAGAGSDDFTRLRRAGNSGLTAVANLIFGSEYTDLTFGFNGYWRSTINHLWCIADGFEFEIQAALRAASVGMQTSEVPTYEGARIGGKSKLNPVTDGTAILRIIVAEASPRRAARFGAAAFASSALGQLPAGEMLVPESELALAER